MPLTKEQEIERKTAQAELLESRDSNDKATFFLGLYRRALSLQKSKLYEYFLDHAVQVTKSKIGFFHFVNDHQKTIVLTSWNKQALKKCKANYTTHYAIEKAGNWADSIRLKRPIIYNDFDTSPNQKGLPEGHVRINRLLSFPLIDNGVVIAIFGVGNKDEPYTQDDITQLDLVSSELNKIVKQRQAEAALAASRESYRSLFENMIDGFAYCKMIFDSKRKPIDFEYLEVNCAFERLTGLKKELVLGKRVTEAIPEIKKQNPELFDIYGRVAETGKEEKFEVFIESLSIWLSISVYSPKKGYFAAVFENITEQKRIQSELKKYGENLEKIVEERTSELRAKERMATIGETAGMVGHDIRNPLQAIIGDIYLAKTELASIPDCEEKSSVVESLEEIEINANYINKIVAELQDFVRPLTPNFESVDLQKIVNQVVCTLDIPSNIKIEQSIDDLNQMVSDPAYIQRMLTNLCNNAIQAMPSGGKVTITAYSKDGKAIISVQDRGGGIPEEVRAKLFTPLITTKAKGQGFGLAAVKRFTQVLGGTVRFETELGKGTKFILELPLRNKKNSAMKN